MSYKETFNIDYGMNAWEAGFDPIKPTSVDVTPFIDIAIGLLHLACELGAVKPAAQTAIEENGMWMKIIADDIKTCFDRLLMPSYLVGDHTLQVVRPEFFEWRTTNIT